eukprot:COSAG05_NODE_11321_length_519_cov_0.992857_1_plen_66_part_01
MHVPLSKVALSVGDGVIDILVQWCSTSAVMVAQQKILSSIPTRLECTRCHYDRLMLDTTPVVFSLV